METQIGITERGDAALDLAWIPWVTAKKPAILISKDPLKLSEIIESLIPKLDQPNIIVHATITGAGGSLLEPNVPPPEVALKGYERLIQILGIPRVILRIDPILLTIAPDTGDLRWFGPPNVIEACRGRLRVSFIDAYQHVRERLADVIGPYGIPWSGVHAPIKWRRSALDVIEHINPTVNPVEVCGEPGIECTGCISEKDLLVLGVPLEDAYGLKGQRPACACLTVKHELLTKRIRCPHQCVYCYWHD